MEEVDKNIYFWQCINWIIVFGGFIWYLKDFGLNIWVVAVSGLVFFVGLYSHFNIIDICIREEEANSKEPYY